MLSNAFNYIAGIASIVSLILTLTPFFPDYKPQIRYATVFFFGMLVGGIFASLSAQTIVVQFEGGITQILLLGGAVVSASVVIFVILGIAIGGEVRPHHGAAGTSAFGFFFVLMILYGIAVWAGGPPSYSGRSTSELLALARYYKAHSNPNLALEYYYKALEIEARREPKEISIAIQRELEDLTSSKSAQ